MSTGGKIAIVVVMSILGILIAIGATFGGMYVSYNDRAVDLESQIVAQYDDLQNIKSNYTLKVQEIVQVTDKYKEDLSEIVNATFEGRYGDDGSQAMFQWIQEQNINLDPGMYKEIQVTIKAGRAEFQNAQTRFLDTKRIYNRELNSFVSGFFMTSLNDFPKIKLDEYNTIVAESTRKEFETGTDSAININ